MEKLQRWLSSNKLFLNHTETQLFILTKNLQAILPNNSIKQKSTGKFVMNIHGKSID